MFGEVERSTLAMEPKRDVGQESDMFAYYLEEGKIESEVKIIDIEPETVHSVVNRTSLDSRLLVDL